MPKCSMVVSVTLLALFLSIASSASAAAEDWGAIHRQMGATGKNGYRPYSSRGYQNSVRSHAQTLYSYGQSVQQIPVETAQEHLTQIQSGVASVKKEIAKIDPETAAKAGVQEHIALISRTLTDCEKMCAALEKSIAEQKTDSAGLSAECKVIEQHVDIVRKEETAMLKKMGITLPETRQEGKDKEVKK